MKKFFILSFLAAIIVYLSILSGSSAFSAIPHLINYQGMLTDNSGTPLTDTVTITFKIYDNSSGGNLKWQETQSSVPVINGLFNVILGSVTSIDTLSFSQDYWLDITVGAEHMPTRLKFTSVGYAYRAQWSDTTNYARASGGGTGSPWIFRITDTGDTTITTGSEWGIARYGNVLYGNSDNTHVNLGVACTTGTTGLNVESCTVGGGVFNVASGAGATVGGGGYNAARYAKATVGGGLTNTASGDAATVGGGSGNLASGAGATVAGGAGNTASGHIATVGGGALNAAAVDYATVAGGYADTVRGVYSTVAGGKHNVANGSYVAVGGGEGNIASGGNSTVGGGYFNKATAFAATVGGGASNLTSGDNATVGGGYFNAATGLYATVAGGSLDTASGDWSTVGGGYSNTAGGSCSYAAGWNVKIASGGGYTFAFGRDFTTSTPNAVIFHNSANPIKVGIGTTAPERIVHIKGYNPRILIEAATSNPEVNFKSSGDPDGEVWAIYKDTLSNDLRFYQGGDKITFKTSTGNVGIGTTGPGYKLDVAGQAHATSFPTSSDARLKKDVTQLINVLEKLEKIRGVSFDWNEKYESMGRSTGHREIGVIAQEVEEEFPELVTTWGEEKYRAVDYGRMTAVLIEAIKEQQRELREQRNEIELLKAKIETLGANNR